MFIYPERLGYKLKLNEIMCVKFCTPEKKTCLIFEWICKRNKRKKTRLAIKIA